MDNCSSFHEHYMLPGGMDMALHLKISFGSFWMKLKSNNNKKKSFLLLLHGPSCRQCHVWSGLGCCFVSSWSHAAQQEGIWCCSLCLLHVVLCKCFHCVSIVLLRLSFSSAGLIAYSLVPSWFDNFVLTMGYSWLYSLLRLQYRDVLPEVFLHR